MRFDVRPVYLRTTVLLLFLTSSMTRGGPRYSSRIVNTNTGDIRGIILELNSRHLEPVEAFRGIPYAAPPVGKMRYRQPNQMTAWSGTKLADTFGAVCPQKYPDVTNRTTALQFMPIGRFHYLKKLVPHLMNQSEDCLFLNLYIPGSGNRGLEAPYAVIVYVHGESFEWGAGNPYDGSVLASYGHVIVVTLNYRLGILGFLKTRKLPLPVRSNTTSGGNLALWDIAMALRWVRHNIAAFGGDPTRVTLVGHDTGGALVNLLLISSIAKGLFTRVVLLSGTALSPWATIHNPDSLRTTVGQQLGCLPIVNSDSSFSVNTAPTPSPENDEDIAPCLRTKPISALLDVQIPNTRFMSRWAPSVSVDSETLDPSYAMEHASDTFITCELMLGATTTESYNDFNAADIQYGFEEDQRNRVLRTYIRNAYIYHLNEIFSAVRNEYTDWDKPIQHPINIRDSTMEALSDGHTVSPMIRVAYLHARRGAKTFLYHFGYQTKESDFPQRLGSVRGEDISYFFGMPLVGGMPFFPHNYTRQDMGVAEAVLNFFTNFAKSGDPNEPRGHKTDYGTVKEKNRYRELVWETYETGSQQYLSLTLKPRMKSHYRGHKMAVWLNLIPQLHQPGDEDVSMRHHHFHEREQRFYAGAVRPESFTRLPSPLHAVSVGDSYHSTIRSTECIPNNTEVKELVEDMDDSYIHENEPDENQLIEQIATKHYYSYTAALGVTVGVGCLLLVLNMLIFAGIYYQRDKDRRRHCQNDNSNTENIQLSLRSAEQDSGSRPQSPTIGAHIIKVHEPPPCYTTVNNHPSNQTPSSQTKKAKAKGAEKPQPPLRTSSKPTQDKCRANNVKKRVQIQEISV